MWGGDSAVNEMPKYHTMVFCTLPLKAVALNFIIIFHCLYWIIAFDNFFNCIVKLLIHCIESLLQVEGGLWECLNGGKGITITITIRPGSPKPLVMVMVRMHWKPIAGWGLRPVRVCWAGMAVSLRGRATTRILVYPQPCQRQQRQIKVKVWFEFDKWEIAGNESLKVAWPEA